MTSMQLARAESAFKYGGFLLAMANSLFALAFGVGNMPVYLVIAGVGLVSVLIALPIKAKRLKVERTEREEFMREVLRGLNA